MPSGPFEEPAFAVVAHNDEVVVYCDHAGCGWTHEVHRHATFDFLHHITRTHQHKLSRRLAT